MAPSIDENNLLVFDPSSASIIFTVGEGLLIKSKNIVASLTQALILFSDRVVDQEISFIRFQHHRMVFIHEQDLFGVKLVPKDQLTKNFVPSIKIILNIQNQLKKLDSSVQELAQDTIRNFYNLIKNPDQNLYIFPESIEGYLSLLTMMATLNYDLSINLESIRNNFLILKENTTSNLEGINLEKINGIICFGLNVSSQLRIDPKIQTIQIDLKDSIFNVIFPNNKSIHKLISQIIGTESSSYIISQIINREQSINEVALSLVKLPDSKMSVEIAIEAISNFSKEQRLAKPLYRIIIKRLKDLEGNAAIEFPEYTELQNDKVTVQKEEINATLATNKSIPKMESEEKAEESPKAIINENIFSKDDLTTLANEFSSKLEDLTKSDSEESQNSMKIEFESKRESSKLIAKSDLSSLKLDQDHFFMENFKVYFDFSPYKSGVTPEPIMYRPSIQLIRVEEGKTQINIKISPTKNNWFWDTCKSLQEQVNIEFTGEDGFFQIITNDSYLFDVLRVAIWSAIIEIIYAIQNGDLELPFILNISNKSNLCIILELSPERRKQLPSQIEKIIEEEKFFNGTDIKDLVNSFDNVLFALSHALNTRKGVGLVLRKNSKELSLVLEFVLTLSEICGIGWSRW